MKYRFEFELDNFNLGDCYNCPICKRIETYDEDDGYDFYEVCPLDDDSENCPLIEVV